MVILRNNNVLLVGGIVKSLREGTGAGEGRVVNIVLDSLEYDKERKTNVNVDYKVSFWNTDKVQMADRVRNANIQPGTYLTVLMSKHEDGTYFGSNFKFPNAASWHFPATEDKPELNVLMGNAIWCKMEEDGSKTNLLTSTKEWNKETSEAEEVTERVTFWDNTANGGSNMAARAAKCLIRKEGYPIPRAIMVCGAGRPYTGKDGKTTVGYSCNQFYLLPANKAE